jgi:hypothetical protein
VPCRNVQTPPGQEGSRHRCVQNPPTQGGGTQDLMIPGGMIRPWVPPPSQPTHPRSLDTSDHVVDQEDRVLTGRPQHALNTNSPACHQLLLARGNWSCNSKRSLAPISLFLASPRLKGLCGLQKAPRPKPSLAKTNKRHVGNQVGYTRQYVSMRRLSSAWDKPSRGTEKKVSTHSQRVPAGGTSPPSGSARERRHLTRETPNGVVQAQP